MYTVKTFRGYTTATTPTDAYRKALLMLTEIIREGQPIDHQWVTVDFPTGQHLVLGLTNNELNLI